MLKIDSRESAHIKSRVKDESKVPNIASYTALLAAITPLSKNSPKSNDPELYEPVLIRDTESLIANFGDPRIDPEKYCDLYQIMNIVSDGGTCYVAKVPSGNTGTYHYDYVTVEQDVSSDDSAWKLLPDEDGTDHKIWKTNGLNFKSTEAPKIFNLSVKTNATTEIIAYLQPVESNPQNGQFTYSFTEDVSDNNKSILTITLGTALEDGQSLNTLLTSKDAESTGTIPVEAYSSLTEQLTLEHSVIQAKPYSLDVYYYKVSVKMSGNEIALAKVKLDKTLTNSNFVNAINSSISSYVKFELGADADPAACYNNDYGATESKPASEHFNKSIVKKLLNIIDESGTHSVNLPEFNVDTDASFEVSINNYVNTLEQYKDRRYPGCIMADMTAPVTKVNDDGIKELVELSTEDRRSLHYHLKEIAAERKDITVLLSTPLHNDDGNAMSLDDVCNWVSSNSNFSDLWEYSQTETTDYTLQGFYLDIYYSWLTMKVTKLQNGSAITTSISVAPSGAVLNNVLKSYRERGVQYPVAGDQFGTLSDMYTVINNPATKMDRDQLVSYRINPIYDTGTRGVQIYGNETLNAGYTDLNAAHIARTLVRIRSLVDEYTEKLKFSINNITLYTTWKNYVSLYILDDFKSSNALSAYTVAMGTDTTSPEEIANRMARGIITLQFYQSAEIFDLEFVVKSSSLESIE